MFDIAERAIIDRNTKANDLFFYNPTNEDLINFRRFIIKSSIENLDKFVTCNNTKCSIENQIVFYKFQICNDFYYVYIDEQNLSQGFYIDVVPTEENYIIGVCF